MKKYVLFLGLVLFFPCIAIAHGVSEEAQAGLIDGGLLSYTWLGATHMLTGYDHLLFLFGVIFFLDRLSDIVKFITVFTIGHSLTLVFATLMEWTANYYLVDAVIALTVVYKGFDNINGFRKYFKVSPPNLLLMVFIFGLIHGFGLSTRLQELPLSLDGLVLKILSFNVGVELGQVAALSGMLILLKGWRNTRFFKKTSLAMNIALIVAGFSLFVYQLYEYDHEASHLDHEVHEHYEGNKMGGERGEDEDLGSSPSHSDEEEHSHGHDHDHHHHHK